MLRRLSGQRFLPSAVLKNVSLVFASLGGSYSILLVLLWPDVRYTALQMEKMESHVSLVHGESSNKVSSSSLCFYFEVLVTCSCSERELDF